MRVTVRDRSTGPHLESVDSGSIGEGRTEALGVFLIRALTSSGLPASRPKPLTMFSTPGGRMSSINSIRQRIDKGVCSAGLRMTQLPAARAGASFHAAIRMGKFQGMMRPTTPSGSW